jgi:hypothetical protein
LKFNGQFVELGSYKNIVYRHDESRKINVSIQFDHKDEEDEHIMSDLDNSSEIVNPKCRSWTSRLASGKRVSMTFSLPREFKEGRVKEKGISLVKIKYDFMGHIVSNEENGGMKGASFELTKVEEGHSYYKFTDPQMELLYLTVCALTSTSRTYENEFMDPVIAQAMEDAEDSGVESDILQNEPIDGKTRQLVISPDIGILPESIYRLNRQENRIGRFAFQTPIFGDLIFEFEEELKDIEYLGPLRNAPSRFYDLSSLIGAQVDQTPLLIHKDRGAQKQLNQWFEEFEIPYWISTRSLGNTKTGDFIFLYLIDKKTNTEISPKDVGFGIGQLLPILVKGITSSKKTIAVEQPEIHLHPKMQASLADFFINTATRRIFDKNNDEVFYPLTENCHHFEPSKDWPYSEWPIAEGNYAPTYLEEQGYETLYGNQWIVETHSETLILRMQRRIRQKKISSEDVSVLYVNPLEDGGSEILQLRLDENGDFIDPWPHGFFDEDIVEIFGDDI